MKNIARKIATFKKDPIGAIKFKIACFFRIFLTVWAKFKLRRYLFLFKKRQSVTPGAFPPDYLDLWFLYETVRKRMPRVVLEFGCGCSTIILAQALKDNGSGFLYSLDCDPYWIEAAKKTIPDYLGRFYSIQYSKKIETEYRGIPVFRHGGTLAITPDILYLDSPELTEERQAAVDPLELENSFPPNFYMIVDGRRLNVEFLKKYLKGKYKFKNKWLFGNSTFERMQ